MNGWIISIALSLAIVAGVWLQDKPWMLKLWDGLVWPFRWVEDVTVKSAARWMHRRRPRHRA